MRWPIWCRKCRLLHPLPRHLPQLVIFPFAFFVVIFPFAFFVIIFPFTVLFITFRDGIFRVRPEEGSRWDTGSPFLHWHIIWRRVASRPDGRKRNRRARRRFLRHIGSVARGTTCRWI